MPQESQNRRGAGIITPLTGLTVRYKQAAFYEDELHPDKTDKAYTGAPGILL